MKIRANKKILLSMGVSLSVIVLAVVILTVGTTSGTISFISLGLIVAGVLMFAILLHAATKPKTELVADERVTRINEKAGYTAGWLIMLSVTLMFWADKIWSLNLELKDMYTMTIMVGIYSFFIFRWYYNRKGDV